MVTKIADVTQFKPGQKVIATTDLHKVPEGTRGKVKLSNGTMWARYWVKFDNGEWIGQIDHTSLVEAKNWEQYKRDRIAQAEAAEKGEAVAAVEASTDDDAAADTGGVPEHLLERSRQARARLTGG